MFRPWDFPRTGFLIDLAYPLCYNKIIVIQRKKIMRAFKKICCLFATVMLMTSSMSACAGMDINKLLELLPLPTESSSSDNSSSENSSPENSSVEEEQEEEEEELPPTEEELAQMAIVDDAYTLATGESLSGTYTLTGKITKIETAYSASKGTITIVIAVKGRETKPISCYSLKGVGAETLAVGDTVTVSGTLKNYKGTIEFDKGCTLDSYVAAPPLYPAENDPYVSVSKTEFYATYTPAVSSADAYYRSQHGLMSGELTIPDQAPVLASNQPKANGAYIRNSTAVYSKDGNTYTVVHSNGEKAFEIYKYGAYITLEEVAAYVYAFGTHPVNHSPSKNTSPTDSVWGEYLRVNHTVFSGNTNKYPYEPKLPNITGCGGTLTYYEMDIGTTGTDCDPSYPITVYNNGNNIERGAARIVYGKSDLNGNGIFEIGEFHVFYTYNHYNDFQEYLNYYGGWGEKFGNITGGGTLSSKSDFNPTAYVTVAYQPLV